MSRDDGTTAEIVKEVRAYMAKRDNHFASHRLADTGLITPEDSKRHGVNTFAEFMDAHTRRIMHQFPDMTPVEWEAFLELIPNVRKVLGMSGWGGVG